MKKLNKFFAILVSLAMMATLCVVMAFAEGEQVTQSTAPGKAVLTKVFDVPTGVTVPSAEFYFDFDYVSGPVDAATISEQDIKWTKTDGVTGEQLKNIYLKDVFKYDATTLKIANDSVLTQPGEYTYTVYENQTNSKLTAPDTATAEETLTLSKVAYTLRVYVIRDADNALAVKTITVQKAKDAEGNTVTNGDKVNPDEQKENEGTENEKSLGSAFKFENVYTKTLKDTTSDDTDPDLKNAALAVKKVVEESGDPDYEYTFKASLTIPEEMKNANEAQTFDAYINGDTTKKVTFTVTANATTSNEAEFKLANTDVLKFEKFPAGGTLTVKENVGSETRLQYAGKYYGSATGMGIADATYTDGAALTATTAAVDAQGKVTVTNKLKADDITPTGILISNLPYIALALVAIGGLVAYVVVRRRQDDEA